MVYYEAAYRHGFPLYIGHRGGGGRHVPENTIAAFTAGRSAGATVLETDLRLTRDGRVVPIHDPELHRVAGIDRPVSRVEYQDISDVSLIDAHGDVHERSGIPLFSDVLEHFPDVAFNIDIKSTEPLLLDRVLEVIRRADATNRVCLASFSPTVMRRIRRNAPHISVSMHPGEVRRFLLSPRLVGPRARALQVPPRYGVIRIVTPATVRRAHARGIEVHVWTINDPPEAARLRAIGVDGIITDDVAAIRGDGPTKGVR